MPNQWSSSAFDCAKEPVTTLLWCICPPFVSAQTAQKMGGDFGSAFCKSCICGCIPIIGCMMAAADRRNLRTKYDLPPEPCDDLMVACCIGGCGTCQEAREVNYRIGVVVDKPPAAQQVSVMPPPTR